MSHKYRPGDRVRYNGKVGEIDNMGYSEKHEENLYIVKYDNGKKEKALESALSAAEEVRITVNQFDEAVKALMYSIAEDVGDTAQLDGVLEIVGGVCGRLKARLFDKND